MWRGMLSEQDIAASGVPLSLVRLAAGTEDTEDLVADVLRPPTRPEVLSED